MRDLVDSWFYWRLLALAFVRAVWEWGVDSAVTGFDGRADGIFDDVVYSGSDSTVFADGDVLAGRPLAYLSVSLVGIEGLGSDLYWNDSFPVGDEFGVSDGASVELGGVRHSLYVVFIDLCAVERASDCGFVTVVAHFVAWFLGDGLH